MLFPLHMVMMLVTDCVIRPSITASRHCARLAVRAWRTAAPAVVRAAVAIRNGVVVVSRTVRNDAAAGIAAVRTAWQERRSAFARHRRSRGAHARSDLSGLRSLRPARPAELARTGNHSHRR